MSQMTTKELEMQGCRTFVCPNISLIDEKGKALFLKDRTIKRAKELTIEYFKKTYRKPRYSSAKHLLPAFIYIASVLEGERRFQKEIAEVFGTTNITVAKWYRDIVETMKLEVECDNARERNGNRRRTRTLKICDVDINPDLDLIEEGGNILGSDSLVIKRAKDLSVKYFNKIRLSGRYPPTTKTILPGLLYLASILEKDRRRQMDIAEKFNVLEPSVSVWCKEIMDVVGMKIIYGFDKKVLKVLEE